MLHVLSIRRDLLESFEWHGVKQGIRLIGSLADFASHAVEEYGSSLSTSFSMRYCVFGIHLGQFWHGHGIPTFAAVGTRSARA
jgi:hypothetical protein